MAEQGANTIRYFRRQNVLELAGLCFGTVQGEEIVEHPEGQTMPPDQLPCSLFAFRQQFDRTVLEVDPAVLGKVLEDPFAVRQSAVLDDLVDRQPSLFPKRPDNLKQLVFFLDLQQHTQRRMARLTFCAQQSLLLNHGLHLALSHLIVTYTSPAVPTG